MNYELGNRRRLWIPAIRNASFPFAFHSFTAVMDRTLPGVFSRSGSG